MYKDPFQTEMPPFPQKWGIQLFATETSHLATPGPNSEPSAAVRMLPAALQHTQPGFPRRCWCRVTWEDDRTDPAFGSQILPDQFSNTVDDIKNKYKVSF